jgi:hypothetical protein
MLEPWQSPKNTHQPPGVLVTEENAKNDGRNDDEPAASGNETNPHHVGVVTEHKKICIDVDRVRVVDNYTQKSPDGASVGLKIK